MRRRTYKQQFNAKYNQPLDQPNSLEDISRLTGYQLKGLKTIFEKGEGAYYNNPQSVRKGITSPQAWREANPERNRARNKAWKIANPERQRAHQKAWETKRVVCEHCHKEVAQSGFKAHQRTKKCLAVQDADL
jgi:hypothetical protein